MAPLLIDSLGPIRVGMTPRQASSALGAPVVVNREDFNPSCRYAHIKGLPELPLFMVLNGHIARIDVYPRYVKRGKSFRPVLRSGIKTPEGAGLGSREQEVIDLYPGRVKITPHPYARPGHYLTVRPDDPSERRYRYVFETDGEKVTAFRSGKTQAVAFIEGCA